MEKPQQPKKTHDYDHQKQREDKIIMSRNSNSNNNSPRVWDCDSSLYDSYELKSFERRLNSAITSTRTLSMPHLTTASYKSQQPQQTHVAKKSSKFSKSFYKLFRSLFRPKHHHQQQSSNFYRSQDGFYGDDDGSSTLSAIPELPEMAPDYYDLSPEFKSLSRRTASDRFTATSIAGISCM